MKVILEPTVTVVGSTQFFAHPEYLIPDDGTNAEKLGSFAAKGCYGSHGINGRSNLENQREVIAHGHGSVIEHSYASLFIEGISRALSLELNRHRLLNISQRSTRYTKEEDAAIVLEPYYAYIYDKYGFNFDQHDETWHQTKEPDNYSFVEVNLVLGFLYTTQKSLNEYADEVSTLEMLNPHSLKGFDLRKWARGKARNVLPNALETKGTWTGNYRAWRWIIESRSDKHAEPEIRRLADKILNALQPLAPTYFEDFDQHGEYEGIPIWKPKHHKV